jgi:membrane protein HdeD
MTEVLQRRRTGWDIALGVLLVVGGVVVLGNVVVATAVSTLFVGWCALIVGLALLVAGLVKIVHDFSWSVLLGGAGLSVLGLFMVRNPQATAVALTLTAGALFLATGLARVFLAFTLETHRWLLVASGLVSVVLGLWVLFNPGVATLTLLGVLLGIQVLVEGVTVLVQGRMHLTPLAASPVVERP